MLEPLPGHAGEPEIHARLCEALGAFDEDDVAPLRAAAEEGRAAFADAFFAALAAKPELGRCAPILLYRTLGPTLPDGAAAAAALWGAAHRCAQENPDVGAAAGFTGEGLEPGEQLFDAILASPSGVVFSVDEPEIGLARLAHRRRARRTSRSPSCSTSSTRSPREPAPGGDRLPVRAVGRRAPVVHRQHDLPRPGVAEEATPAGSLRISPADAEAARRGRRRPGPGHHQAGERRRPRSR